MMVAAYVDGSYIKGKVGYGAVLLGDDKSVVQEFSGGVDSDTSARQVAGELVAVMTVLDYCTQHNINSIDIYYDYKGIEEWATGGWKTNTPLTKRYAAYMEQSPVAVRWHKVKSHSGDEWNDRADELAKQGAESAQTSHSAAIHGQALLAATAEHFVTILRDEGIMAEFDRVFNDQYARILIFTDDKRSGFFDLYNTKNRPYKPYLHGFKDKALKARIEALWQAYRQTLSADDNSLLI